VTVEKDEALGLGGLSQARLRSLDFDAQKGSLRASFDGVAQSARSRGGAFVNDRRLTLFHNLRYSWRWALIAVSACWLVATTWAGFEAWKKLAE
jgi:hypothetical protein